MNKIIAPKLKSGDTVMVIAPSMSLSLMKQESVERSIEVLQKLGLKVVFAKNTLEIDGFKSSSISSRVEDIHEAFSNHEVKMILCTMGGYNCNQLLEYIRPLALIPIVSHLPLKISKSTS